MTWIYQSVNTILSALQWKISPPLPRLRGPAFPATTCGSDALLRRNGMSFQPQWSNETYTIRFRCVKYPNCSRNKCFDGLIDIGYIQCMSHFRRCQCSARVKMKIISSWHACGWVIHSKVSYPFRWVHLCKSNHKFCLCSRGPWAMGICPVEKIVQSLLKCRKPIKLCDCLTWSHMFKKNQEV